MPAIDPRRIVFHREGIYRPGPVVYWMSRDQRAMDNWALLHAQQEALRTKSPLAAVFCLAPEFLGATRRQYGFMLRGLRETAASLRSRQIAFLLLQGKPGEEVPRYMRRIRASALVADFDPLRIKRAWQAEVTDALDIPFSVVDSHNIVPCRVTSAKREYGAYTIRPKIMKLLPEFLTDIPPLRLHPFPLQGISSFAEWENLLACLPGDQKVPESCLIRPGEKEAGKVLREFIRKRLAVYHERRNDPVLDGQSNLSPFLHFGQVSAQRVALMVRKADASHEAKAAFLEELIVRRELSDNFCLHAQDYDSESCFPDWAEKTLDAHRKDRREHVYTLREFEECRTHDPLWNACQREMVLTGKMHGYMRMYWAKKILEWTRSPGEAMRVAIELNDRYELDGRDPSGYAGIAWSMGGVHDRAWSERPVFGKIRYMSPGGMKRKFDVAKYIAKVRALEP